MLWDVSTDADADPHAHVKCHYSFTLSFFWKFDKYVWYHTPYIVPTYDVCIHHSLACSWPVGIVGMGIEIEGRSTIEVEAIKG